MIKLRIGAVIGSLLVVIASSSAFFRYVEGWSWLDSYFFTVVTISTVGYGNMVPQTALGKIGTTIIIFAGLGVFAMAIQQIAQGYVLEGKNRLEKKLAQMQTDIGTATSTLRGKKPVSKPDLETPRPPD